MLDKMPKCISEDLDYLVKEYEKDSCVFTEDQCLNFLTLYLDRMKDCHFKAVLYKHLCYLEDRGFDVYDSEEYP